MDRRFRRLPGFFARLAGSSLTTSLIGMAIMAAGQPAKRRRYRVVVAETRTRRLRPCTLAGVGASVDILAARPARRRLPRGVRAPVAAPGPDLPSSRPHRARESRAARSGAPSSQRKLEAGPQGAGLERLLRLRPRRGRGNRVLFDRSEGNRRKLASNQKLFTTLTAMHRLGPDSRIATKVKARGRVSRKGKLSGDVYLVGAGDPTFGAGRRRRPRRQVRGRDPQGQRDGDRRRQRLRPPARRPRLRLRPQPLHRAAERAHLRRLHLLRRPGQAGGRAFRDGAARRRGQDRRQGQGRPGSRSICATAEPSATYDSPRIASIARRRTSTRTTSTPRCCSSGSGRPSRAARAPPNGGAKAVERFARSVGSEVAARDGSGLTDGNKSSPRDVVRLLAAAQREKRSPSPSSSRWRSPARTAPSTTAWRAPPPPAAAAARPAPSTASPTSPATAARAAA